MQIQSHKALVAKTKPRTKKTKYEPDARVSPGSLQTPAQSIWKKEKRYKHLKIQSMSHPISPCPALFHPFPILNLNNNAKLRMQRIRASSPYNRVYSHARARVCVCVILCVVCVGVGQ